MANILICGDSWACGEWDIACTKVAHTGLQQYLVDDGHTVFNISKGGTSNLDNSNRLNLWFERFGSQHIDTVLVFQTDYVRDFKHNACPEDWNSQLLSDVAERWVERFYHRLSELSQKHGCKIKIIGGLSDTVWFDQMSLDYPGCEVACQSLVNLTLANNHRIDVPIFSWYTADSEPILARAKSLGLELDCTLKLMHQGFERESLVRENPEFFYPDGIHPNRRAHRMLYEFLRHKSIIPN
jgi:lysophospholipase L1-like esterase